MKNLLTLSLGLLLFFFFACGNETLDSQKLKNKIQPRPLNFGIESFTQQERDCDQAPACLRINLQYPVAQNGKIGVRNAINEYIQQVYIRTLVPADESAVDTIQTLKLAGKKLENAFKAYLQQQGNLSSWERKSKGEILYQN